MTLQRKLRERVRNFGNISDSVKDICYVVRLEEDEKEWWLGNSNGGYYANYSFRNATHFNNENDVKAALKEYYTDTHTIKEGERAFVCKVLVSECACFMKSDIDLLLKKND